MRARRPVADHELVQLATRVPQALWRAGRLAALDAAVPFKDWVAEALAEHLARHRSPQQGGKKVPQVGAEAPPGPPEGRGQGRGRGEAQGAP
jgi:hypothetical protein